MMNNRAFMRQARELQAKMLKAQEDLEKATVEATAGGGAVTIVMNGQQKLLSVKISPEAVDPKDVGLLEDLILTAINDAQQKSQELAQKSLGALTGGLNIPGLT
jgi:nucleoid-associated protein EbfC